MNKIPNSSPMIGEFFREGKSLSPQSRYYESHGIIKSFYIVCLTSILSYSSVSFFRKNYSVSTPKVCITYSTLTINCGERIPQSPRASFISFTNIYSYNLWKSTHQWLTKSTACYSCLLQMTTFHHIEELAFPFFLTSLPLVSWRLLTFY